MTDPMRSIRESLSRLTDEPPPPVYAPLSLERCSYCEKPSDELVTYVDGVGICLPCRSKEEARADAAYAEAGYGAMQPLEQRYWDGDR